MTTERTMKSRRKVDGVCAVSTLVLFRRRKGGVDDNS
jgi:hypothetical protein